VEGAEGGEDKDQRKTREREPFIYHGIDREQRATIE
jgi:hypothetical protein